jgi:response regulator RpfG family c-di-GMP phosphodiesterase/putative methionine-R-sulfoxide reductase with GAF domain
MSARQKPTSEAIEILIAEDSLTQAEALKYILEKQGYQVVHARDGQQALGLLGEHSPALVISDITMPEMNGYELCQHIKADTGNYDIPVILLTALSDKQDVVEGLACGADSFITKPYSENSLLTHIEEILARPLRPRSERAYVDLSIIVAGKTRTITADPQLVLSLGLSTYEAAIQRNRELVQAQDALSLLNEQLEDKVETRTAALSAEIAERQRMEEEVRRRMSELEALFAASQAIGQMLQPQEIGQKILEILSERFGWRHTAFYQYDAENETIELLAMHQPGLENEAQRLAAAEWFNSLVTRPGQGMSGWVIQHGEPIYCSDVTKDSRYIEAWPEVRSGMYVPLKVGERTIGCLGIELEQAGSFSETDEWLITTLASQTASALENARLFETAQRNLRRLEALRSIDTAINSGLDINLTLKLLLEQVADQLGAHAAGVMILDQESQRFHNAARRGFQTSALQQSSVSMGDGYAGRAALERRTICVPNLADDASTFKNSPHFTKEGFVSLVSTPLIAKGKVTGVLEVFHREPLKMNPDWIAFLETLAGEAAIAIDSIQIFDHLQRSNTDLISAYHATIEGWSRALDLRDKETEGHTQRVTEITLQLAREMEMSSTDTVHIQRGALLHDIGKMGVPDSILHKPGPLTDEEWVIMRKHPNFAYDLISPIEYLRPSLDIPYCHHEKWDGTGYPRGLKGEQIPLSARLFAVVDVWDALTSDRPYRAAWTAERALTHIQEQTGTHFDPQVVEVFVRTHHQDLAVKKTQILIVDDDADVTQGLANDLGDQYEVLTADSGKAALGHFESKSDIAVILTDYQMATMNGIQLLAQVYKINPAVVGILMSGKIDQEILREAINLGNVRGFITKPFKLDEIRYRLEETLNDQRLASQQLPDNKIN